MNESSMSLSPTRRNWILSAMSGSLSLAFLDQMNLPVALPTIQEQLLLSSVSVQWLVNAYLLSWAVFVLTGGYLADEYGPGRIFCAGVLLFGISSLACAVSYSGRWLIAFRALQGMGTALMLPAAMGILIGIYPKERRGRAIGIYSGCAAVFLALGPFMGGFFTQYLSWRFIFWVNIPLALYSFVIPLCLLPKLKRNYRPFDFSGFLLFTLGFPCFILALMEGNTWGWGSKTILFLFFFSFTALPLFVLREGKAKNPFLDFSLFRYKGFLASNFVFFVVQFVLILPVFWALYLQRILEYGPLASGLFIMIAVLPLIVVIPLGGILSDVFGVKTPVIIGLIITTLSLCWFFIFKVRSIERIIPGMFAFGTGVALLFAPVSAYVVGSVHPEKRGIASGVLGCIRQAGGTIGMAVIGSMFLNIRKMRFESLLKDSRFFDLSVSDASLEAIYLNRPGLTPFSRSVFCHLRSLAAEAYVYSFQWIYAVCILLLLAACLTAFFSFRKISRNTRD